MLISVITVCKNAANTVEAAIQSVLNQSYQNIEYIILDGDSQDGTQAIVAQYQDELTYFASEPDGGIYDAMNKGIDLAQGDYLYFLNADDYVIDQNVFQDFIDYAKTNPEAGFIYGDFEVRLPNGDRPCYTPSPPEQFTESLICLNLCPVQQCIFFKAEIFKLIGPFNQTYRIAADYDWYTRLAHTPEVHLAYFPRLVVSYASEGLSSHLEPLFQEIFAIQNSFPVYQETDWLRRRIELFQAAFLQLNLLSKDRGSLIEAQTALINTQRDQIDLLTFSYASGDWKGILKAILKTTKSFLRKKLKP